MTYRVAIVEDNATARASLRSHLMLNGEVDVSSFSSGTELKAALRKQHFELIILDFHLGQHKNGAEWIQHLRQSTFLRPSTGVIFLTSDRLPQTVGRIIDTQPDALIIKPYTIANLTRAVNQYFAYRNLALEALRGLDSQSPSDAMSSLNKIENRGVPAKLRSDFLRLKARVLFDTGALDSALALYESVLVKSQKVLWAQWGKIRCQYEMGLWPDCDSILSGLLTNSLARDKAFEWLACLSAERENWSDAEFYLDHIRPSELSVSATKLKSLAYQKQDRVMDGIALLQRQRDFNRSARERFNDFTFELAEFYLQIAQNAPATNRWESLQQARKLLGVAGRSQGDQQTRQKRDLLMAYSSVLEGDHDRASEMLEDDLMQHFTRSDTATLITAATVFGAIGKKIKARELLEMAGARNHEALSVAERISNQTSLSETERQLGFSEDIAVSENEKGMSLFIKKQYIRALPHFYKAHVLMPATAVFSLNLLHTLYESRTSRYRKTSCSRLIQHLGTIEKNAANQHRYEKLSRQIEQEAAELLTLQHRPSLADTLRKKEAEELAAKEEARPPMPGQSVG